MAKNKQDLDIAQRISKTIARTGEPRMTATGTFDPEGDGVVLGKVPLHLQHLHNLLDEVGDEVVEAEQKLHKTKKQMKAVRDIFFGALDQYVPSVDKEGNMLRCITLCTGWQVVGTKADEDGMFPGLDPAVARVAEMFSESMDGMPRGMR